MNEPLLDQIANAILYEGHSLYPYRPSQKDRQRWTFGGLYPRAYSEAQTGADAWWMQTECLVLGAPAAELEIKVRFLQLTSREVAERDASQRGFHLVDRLEVGDRLLIPWQEAMERECSLDRMPIGSLLLSEREHVVRYSAGQTIEAIGATGLFVRTQHDISAGIAVAAERVSDRLFKVRVRIENRTPWDASNKSRDDALMGALVSTQTRLGIRDAEFVSLLDPPEDCRAAADACRNVGTWPVLVGEPMTKNTMLSTAIILYDYPQVAPESPGDLFDATEIDEILTLRIRTLTDNEKHLAAAVDERAGALLDRTEGLAEEKLRRLHGMVRENSPILQEPRHDE